MSKTSPRGPLRRINRRIKALRSIASGPHHPHCELELLPSESSLRGGKHCLPIPSQPQQGLNSRGDGWFRCAPYQFKQHAANGGSFKRSHFGSLSRSLLDLSEAKGKPTTVLATTEPMRELPETGLRRVSLTIFLSLQDHRSRRFSSHRLDHSAELFSQRIVTFDKSYQT